MNLEGNGQMHPAEQRDADRRAPRCRIAARPARSPAVLRLDAQTSRKDTSRVTDYRIRKQTAGLSPLLRRMQIRHRLRSLCRARMLVRRVEREMPTRRSGANMNSTAATLVIAERVRQRLLSHHEAWRCQGEYVGGCLCDGCGERITCAQASYEVTSRRALCPIP